MSHFEDLCLCQNKHCLLGSYQDTGRFLCSYVKKSAINDWNWLIGYVKKTHSHQYKMNKACVTK